MHWLLLIKYINNSIIVLVCVKVEKFRLLCPNNSRKTPKDAEGHAKK